MRHILAVVAAVALCTPAIAADSSEQRPISFLICQPGGPDLRPEQEQIVERLYRYIEKKTGLAAGRIKGVYTNDRAVCLKELAKKPDVLFPSLPIFLEFKSTYQLRPVAQLKLAGKVEDYFYILAKAGGTFELDSGKPATVTGTHLGSRRFVYDVLLDNKVKPDVLTLRPERLGLRAIRKVVKGQADAVLLDGSQYRALVGTRYEKKLRLVRAIGPFPTPPVTVLDGRPPRGFPEALGAALAAMKNDATGRDVLEMFDIEGFARPGPRAFASLEARFLGTP